MFRFSDDDDRLYEEALDLAKTLNPGSWHLRCAVRPGLVLVCDGSYWHLWQNGVAQDSGRLDTVVDRPEPLASAIAAWGRRDERTKLEEARAKVELKALALRERRERSNGRMKLYLIERTDEWRLRPSRSPRLFSRRSMQDRRTP
jgi:hypothetical protein